MAKACDIIPKASNGKDSILFKDLLELYNRDKATSIYKKALSPTFVIGEVDANGEPTIKSLKLKKLEAENTVANELKETNVLEEGSFKDKAGREVFKVKGDDTRTRVKNRLEMQKLVDKGVAQPYGATTDQFIFLSKTAKDNRPANEVLNEKLTGFLANYGIRVEHINNMKERVGVDANGAAVIFEKLILIADGKEKIDTLPEEVSHFAVELLGEENPLIKRMMDTIEESTIYKDTYEEYSKVYLDNEGNPDIRRIKKEAIGKAITEKIIKNQETGLTKSQESTLARIWKKLLSYFKKIKHKNFIDEVDIISDWVAKDVLKGKLTDKVVNLSKKETYFQKPASKSIAKKQEEFLTKTIKALENRLKTLKKLPNKAQESDELKGQIDKLKILIDNKKIKSGIVSFVNGVDKELQSLLEYSEKYKNQEIDSNLTTSKIYNMGKFISTYDKLLSDVNQMIDYDSELRNEMKDTLSKIKTLDAKIQELRKFYNVVSKDSAVEALIRMNNGRLENVDEDIFDNPAEKDTNIIRRYVGTMKNAADPVLKLIYDSLKKIKNNTTKYTYEKGRELLNEQIEMQRAGFKDMGAFFEKDAKGNKTGYIISEYNRGEYYKALDAFKEKLAKSFGFESYSELNPESLNVAQKQSYRSEWTKFLSNTKLENFENKEFDKIKNNPAAMKYYNKIMELKEEQDSKIPISKSDRQKYLAPQMRKDMMERLRNKEGNIATNIKEVLKEGAIITEDDIEFNQRKVIEDVTGKEIKFVPVHFTRRLNDMSNLSEDLTSMMIAYTGMSENYKNSYDIVPELELIREQLGQRPIHNDKHKKPGTESNTYAMVSDFMNSHLYGDIKKKDQSIKVGDKTINYGKLLDTFNSYVRRNNLAFNIFSTTASYTSGSIFSKIEDVIGQYTNQESKLFAESEFDTQFVNVVSEIGKKRPTNKMHLMFSKFGFVGNKFDDLNVDTRAGREIKNVFFSTYQMVDYRVKGKIALAIMDNMRLVGNEWMTKDQFKRYNKDLDKSEINSKWKALRDKSFYNAYETVNGELKLKKEFEGTMTSDVENGIKNRVDHIGNRADGMLSELDRGAIYQSVWGRLIMTHRGWLVKGVEDRAKVGAPNLDTGEWEEGYYRTVASFTAAPLLDLFKEWFHGRKGSIKPFVENYQNLNEAQKKNVKRVMVEMAAIAGLWILIKALESAVGDDEDDYLINFALYSLYRTKLEVGAFYQPGEVITILQSPAAGINQLESIIDSFSALFDWDEIERGKYKGYTKAEKLLIQRSILKNFYEAQYPKEKLKYIRNI